jgi:hypothetical protein
VKQNRTSFINFLKIFFLGTVLGIKMSLVHTGTYGGGKSKPFRYTEVQRHRFQLKSKEGTADRQVPLMPLSFTNAKARTSAILTGRAL